MCVCVYVRVRACVCACAFVSYKGQYWAMNSGQFTQKADLLYAITFLLYYYLQCVNEHVLCKVFVDGCNGYNVICKVVTHDSNGP